MTTLILPTWLALIVGLVSGIVVIGLLLLFGWFVIQYFIDIYWEKYNYHHHKTRAEWHPSECEPNSNQFPIICRQGAPSDDILVKEPQEYYKDRMDWYNFCFKNRIVYWVSLSEVHYKLD